MKKKYLKTVEDVLALKNTNTKIYSEFCKDIELIFIDGVLCKKNINTGCFDFNIEIFIDPHNNSLYILEEEPMQEAGEADVGKLCKFWDNDKNDFIISILRSISQTDYPFEDDFDCEWLHCRRLSPSEVAEITGYGVTENGSTFYGEPFKVVGEEK